MPNFPVPVTRFSRTSLANTALTVSSEPAPYGRGYVRVVFVTYSATIAADLAILITLNSAAGSDFDIRLAAIDLVIGERWGYWVPDVAFPLAPGDVIDALAPADANGTSSVMIYMDFPEPTQDGEGGYQIEPTMGAR